MTREQATLVKRLAATEPRIKALYVSTYIPRECGIATYTKDLTNAINLLNPYYLADIIAIDDENSGGKKVEYPWEVKYKIEQESLKSWLNAADYINQSGAEVVVLQHEFGIYGGHRGEMIVPFAEAINKPIIVTFHTVVPNPDDQYRQIVKRLCAQAKAVTVMVNTAVERLVSDYGLDENKIVVIPHGVPDIPFAPSEDAKKELGLGELNILMSFGLVGRGKGYEYVIEALPAILKKHPDTKFLIVGQTHPVVFRQEGEKYRESLQKLARKLGVESALEFVNRYMSLEEIINYLKATDIYITPFTGLDQITSGTLSYAIGAGRACISSPYLYAIEVIDDNRGVLVKPRDNASITKAIIDLLDNPKKRLEIAKRAYAFGRNMIWPSVALRHLDLFEIVTHEPKQPQETS